MKKLVKKWLGSCCHSRAKNNTLPPGIRGPSGTRQSFGASTQTGAWEVRKQLPGCSPGWLQDENVPNSIYHLTAPLIGHHSVLDPQGLAATQSSSLIIPRDLSFLFTSAQLSGHIDVGQFTESTEEYFQYMPWQGHLELEVSYCKTSDPFHSKSLRSAHLFRSRHWVRGH